MYQSLNLRGIALAIVLFTVLTSSSAATVISLNGGYAADGWVAPATPLFAYGIGIAQTNETIQGVPFVGWKTISNPAPTNGAGITVTMSATQAGTFGAPNYAATSSVPSNTGDNLAMASMMAGFVFSGANNGGHSPAGTGPVEITMTGLTPNKSYLVESFTYAGGGINRVNLTFAYNGVTPAGDVFTQSPTGSYLIQDIVQADGTGKIVLDETVGTVNGGSLNPVLSGVLLAAAPIPTPEPSSLMLLGLAAALLAWKGFRRA